jgi:hypothetical protein
MITRFDARPELDKATARAVLFLLYLVKDLEERLPDNSLTADYEFHTSDFFTVLPLEVDDQLFFLRLTLEGTSAISVSFYDLHGKTLHERASFDFWDWHEEEEKLSSIFASHGIRLLPPEPVWRPHTWQGMLEQGLFDDVDQAAEGD